MILLKRCSLAISRMKCWGRLGRFFGESCIWGWGLGWGVILAGIRKESLTIFPRNVPNQHARVQVSLCTWRKIISRVWVDFYFWPLLLSVRGSPVAFYGKLSPGPRGAASHSRAHQALRSGASEARQQVTQTLLVTSLHWKHTYTHLHTHLLRASLVAQMVKNPPAMRETQWVLSLGWEDPLEKRKATHSSILAWRTPWTTVHGVAESDMTEWLLLHFHLFFRKSIEDKN